MNELKKFFSRLQVDSKSVLFIQEQLNDKLFKKRNKSKYKKDKEFVNRFNLLVDKKTDFNKKDDGRYSIPIKAEYCLLLVGLFTSKVYVYGMKNRSLIPLKLEKLYKEVANKRKNKKMRLQTDLEFKQKKDL